MTYWWEGKPWRMIQTNMREIDMADIKAEQVVADLQAFKATAVLFNAAGIVASYPTELPFHYQSQFLTGDSMADVIEACHAGGIGVLARTDFSKIRRPIYEQHPDWAYRTPDGQVVDYNGDIHACINGNYQQIYALKIIEELITTHDLDGIFFNMGGYQTRDYSHNYWGICHCDKCQTMFRDVHGLELPRVEDPEDPVFQKYMVFKRETMDATNHMVWDLIHRLRPEICCNRETELLVGYVRQESNTEPDRPLPHWQYSGSSNTKWAVSTYPSMVSSNTTVDFIGIWYRHVAVSPHEQELRLVQNLASGGQLDFYLIGRLDNHHDKSGYEAVKRVFHYHEAHGDDYVGNASMANVMLLDDSRGRETGTRGWFRFLAESHYLFDLPQTETVLSQSWDKYDAVVLPNLKYVSDELATRIDAFVEAGGTLIATGQSSFYDEDYAPRDVPALKSLGIQEVEAMRDLDRSAYFLMDEKDEFERFPVTDLLYIRSPYWYCRYAESAQLRFKLIPPHNFGPPERTYWTIVTERPAFVVNSYGKGKAIYIPWLPGQLFHRQGHTNTSDFVADVLENVAGISPVEGNLSPMVEVTLFENQEKGQMLLHLVNTSGHFGTSYYAPVPMCDLEVTLKNPSRPSTAESLVTGELVACSFADGTLTLHVPKLELLQAIKLTY